jgi:hypothetical protein
MPDAPEGSISKFAFYLASLKNGGVVPKVVRCLVHGWGVEQHESVVFAAADACGEPTDCDATAVISDYGLTGNQQIEITVFVRGYRLRASFPFKPNGDGFEYINSDDQDKQDVLRMMAAWASATGARPPRKKFLGIF